MGSTNGYRVVVLDRQDNGESQETLREIFGLCKAQGGT